MTEIQAVNKVVNHILQYGDRKATCFVSPKLTVKASLTFKIKKSMRNKVGAYRDAVGIVVTVGKPNYAERAYIKQLVKAGEPFPVKRLKIQYWKNV